ncbi:MAG: hypothetical protein ACTSR8_05115 [Promethearchaeota archaeon]
MSIFIPIFNFLIPFLIFQQLFRVNEGKSFGIWTPENFIIFILTGVNIALILKIMVMYGNNLLQEKFWKTLPSIFISPISSYELLLSMLFAELIVYGPVLIVIFLVCFILMNSSILTMISILIVFLCASIVIGAVGLAIGSFRLSIEGRYTVFLTITNFVLIFSCIKYPKELFPVELESLILVNPFYYYWDLIRNILIFGIEDILINSNFVIHFIIIIVFTITSPILSVIFFNYIFKKYGIQGY